jgi:hypothetical protein
MEIMRVITDTVEFVDGGLDFYVWSLQTSFAAIAGGSLGGILGGIGAYTRSRSTSQQFWREPCI